MYSLAPRRYYIAMVQEQLLDTAGPLTCLWADLLNKGAMVSKEDIVMLVQRAMVLLSSASNTVTLERRTNAWSRFNPKPVRNTRKGKPVYLDQASWRRLQSRLRLARHWTKCLIIQVALSQQPYTSYTKFQPSQLY